MTGLIKYDASCLFQYKTGQVSTTGNEQSLEIYLRVQLEQTIEYGLTLKTTLRGYTLTQWTRANWTSFDSNWISCTDLANLDHPQSIWSGLLAGEELKW